jgi:hypothetical protein
MKLRLYRNSIRFRLGRDEVEQLHSKGSLSESTPIAPGVELTYCLRTGTGAGARVTLESNQLCVELPKAVVADWATSEQVQITAEQETGPEQSLKILVEKDFECLNPGMSESSANPFPNPNKIG